MVNQKTEGRKALIPEFIKWTEREEPLIGVLVNVDYVELNDVAVPRYTIMTDSNRVSFLGTVQLVEALEQVKIGSRVEIIPGERVKTRKGFVVNTFAVYLLDGVEVQAPLEVTTESKKDQPTKA